MGEPDDWDRIIAVNYRGPLNTNPVGLRRSHDGMSTDPHSCRHAIGSRGWSEPRCDLRSRGDDDADVEFFWDPVCPWAWLTSRSVGEVARQRQLTVDWRFISLRLVNADK